MPLTNIQIITVGPTPYERALYFDEHKCVKLNWWETHEPIVPCIDNAYKQWCNDRNQLLLLLSSIVMVSLCYHD
jgi:hypothetical protein